MPLFYRELTLGAGLAGLVLASGVVRSTLDAQQPASVRATAVAGRPEPAPPYLTLLNASCLGGHDHPAREAGLSLEAIATDEVATHADVWEKVIRKLRARQMPPIGEPRPTEATYDAVVSYLETSLDRAASAHPNPGRTATIRRLTRTEYQNAIHDLLALDVNVTSLLPADDSSYGFDNVTVGDLSPTLLERYISAAEKVSRLAVGRASRSPGGDTIRIAPDLTQEEHLDGLPIGTRGGVALPYTFPQDGEYEIQVRLRRDRDE